MRINMMQIRILFERKELLYTDSTSKEKTVCLIGNKWKKQIPIYQIFSKLIHPRIQELGSSNRLIAMKLNVYKKITITNTIITDSEGFLFEYSVSFK